MLVLVLATGSGVGSATGSGVGSATGSGVGSATGSGVGSATGSGVGSGLVLEPNSDKMSSASFDLLLLLNFKFLLYADDFIVYLVFEVFSF